MEFRCVECEDDTDQGQLEIVAQYSESIKFKLVHDWIPVQWSSEIEGYRFDPQWWDRKGIP